MAIQPMALQGQHPQINTVQALGQGIQSRQRIDDNQITLARKGLENIGSIALGAMGGKMDGQADPALFEQGLDMLEQQGINVGAYRGKPEIAPMVARASMSALQQLQEARNQSEYELSLAKFQQEMTKAAAGPKTSLNLAYGQDAQGNIVPLQPTDAGTMVATQMPEGVTLATKSDKIDLGTEWGILDPLTRQVVARVPKDNFGEAYDTASGSASGKADVENRMGAPAAVASAENSIAMIDGVINDPNLDLAIGVGGLLPAIAGTPQAGVVARIEQLQGAAFLQAFESLKGGGQITEVEGKKATDAIARLSRVQNKTDFVNALNDLKSVINIGLERAKSQQGGTQQPEVSMDRPEIGEGTIIENDAGERLILRNGNWEAM